MPDTEKTETKPQASEDPATDEEHPLDVARREGLRTAPLSQTQHLDTTDGGIVDLHRISPVFQEARDHAVRAAAAAADADYLPDTVVFPDDKDEADLAREHVRRAAEELPEDDTERPGGGYADGMSGPYNPDMIEKDQAARAGTGDDASKGEAKAEDEDKGAAAKSSSSSTTKTPAKPATTSRSTTSKTASK
jgi:hypothetical protein